MAGQGRGRPRSDGGDADGAEGAGVAQQGDEALDGVGRRERDPVIGREPARGLPQPGPAVVGVDQSDGRQLDDVGTQLAQAGHQGRGLSTGAGDDHPPSEQGPPVEPAQLEAGHLAYDDGYRRLELDVSQLGQGRAHGALRRARAPPHGRHPSRRVPPSLGEALGDLGLVGHAHEHDDRVPGPGQGLPVDLVVDRVTAVARHHGERGGETPVGDGDPGVGGHGHGRGDPGDDLEGHPGPDEGLGLLAPPAQNEGIAALESHDLEAGQAPVHQQPVDLVLGHGGAGALAHVDQIGPGRGQLQQRGLGQAVVHHHVGPAHHLGAPQGQQPRIAGAGPDQVDRHRRLTGRPPPRCGPGPRAACVRRPGRGCEPPAPRPAPRGRRRPCGGGARRARPWSPAGPPARPARLP